MRERRRDSRNRTLRSGKIAFNHRQSVIDCVVRNLSDHGACLQVNSTAGIPHGFDLMIDGDGDRHCHEVWMSDTRIGVEFEDAAKLPSNGEPVPVEGATRAIPADVPSGELLRSGYLAVRAALDEVPVGIVLLDPDTRAQFINRAFRRMWRLPDAKANGKPPFVALMYHGRDTKAYSVAPEELDVYVSERVAHVKRGDPEPLDLRLTNGEIVRLQCTVLPGGGRMLCYTYVTDIVRHADELTTLRAALDQMQPGLALLDRFLNVQFMNRALRTLWRVPDEQADRKPPFVELVTDAHKTGSYGVAPERLAEFITNRIAAVRAGDPMPIDLPHSDGRVIRAQCSALPSGGRLVSYTDVTDLVQRADRFEDLAAHDSLTGLSNRRHFDALAATEWSRFQRYYRPLSLMLVDIDHFKQINDRHGHDVGDEIIKRVAAICIEGKRTPDIVARLGGDEFAMLLPETELHQAEIVAERLRNAAAVHHLVPDACGTGEIPITLSIGIATANLSMSSVEALSRLADKALYDAKAAGRNCVRGIEAPEGPQLRLAAE